jgi:hypothetical protein
MNPGVYCAGSRYSSLVFFSSYTWIPLIYTFDFIRYHSACDYRPRGRPYLPLCVSCIFQPPANMSLESSYPQPVVLRWFYLIMRPVPAATTIALFFHLFMSASV